MGGSQKSTEPKIVSAALKNIREFTDDIGLSEGAVVTEWLLNSPPFFGQKHHHSYH